MKNTNTMTPEQARQACIDKNKWLFDIITPETFIEMEGTPFEIDPDLPF